jgi:hypothetical protein
VAKFHARLRPLIPFRKPCHWAARGDHSAHAGTIHAQLTFVREQSLDLANSLLVVRHANDAQRIRQAFERTLARDPEPREIARVKVFLAKYSASWLKSHPEASSAKHPHVAKASKQADNEANNNSSDITAGVVRSDNLGQDDPDDTSKQFADETGPCRSRYSAKAAWAAFVQSLYGSAEFQFVR